MTEVSRMLSWLWPYSWWLRIRMLEAELRAAKSEIRKLHAEAVARETAHLIALNAAWSAACSLIHAL